MPAPPMLLRSLVAAAPVTAWASSGHAAKHADPVTRSVTKRVVQVPDAKTSGPFEARHGDLGVDDDVSSVRDDDGTDTHTFRVMR